MILQALAYPDTLDAPGLFFHSSDDSNLPTGSEFTIAPGQRISTDTFYNEFDMDSWRKYCHVGELSFDVRFIGSLELTMRWGTESTGYRNVSIPAKPNASGPGGSVTGTIPPETSGRLSFVLSCTDDGETATVRSLVIESDIPAVKKRMGLVVCTYKRPEIVRESLNRISGAVINNKSSRTGKQLTVVVVDNACDLEGPDLPGIQVVPNANTGGTGGFMKGLMHFGNQESPPEILVFMDDDAVVNPESLERIWSFMSLLKVPRKAMAAGAMIREDAPWVLHEAVAGWTGIRLRNTKTGLNLADRGHLERYHQKQTYRRPYAAWWLCAFTPGDWEGIRLPPPFFIKGDDVYFALANAREVLSLNGIAARHEPFDLKHSPEYNRYFALRNLMITNCRFFGSATLLLNVLCTVLRVLAEVAVYNYTSAGFCLRAMEDFMRGPEYLCSVNHEGILLNLRKTGEKLEPVDASTSDHLKGLRLLDENRRIPMIKHLLKAIIRILTVSGHILPRKLLNGDAVITLGFNHLSVVPVLSRSYYAISKDGQYCVHRRIQRRRGLECLARAALLSLRYAFSPTNRRWREYFRHWDGGEAVRYWSAVNTVPNEEVS